ncbi:hypothetical protein OPIT5_23400 [Opitutaceae bacterium TAV5]|nr:hypothetical protein OPIT5_23400 [Opitutaceae bacterium TAV5]
MTLAKKVADRIRRWPKERVFSRFDFLDLGSTAAVGMALKRMEDAGKIRRVRRGYYDRPRTHPLLGTLKADHKEILAAIARRTGMRLQTAGSNAANELRLTEQVPARIVYETDAPSRKLDLGGRNPIQLKHRPLREIARASESSRFVFAGLRAIGRTHITPERVAHLAKELKPEHRRLLLRDLRYAPAWMHPHLRAIAAGEPKSRT